MKIVDVKAYPTSYQVPKELQVSRGIGTMTKRDCVMVKVTTEDGIVGWGKSHHTRSPISSNLKMACSGRTSSPLALGMTPFTSLRMT
jgi:L-alanine-DL-glutamate epimerase-like enolase superfamily enzyme